MNLVDLIEKRGIRRDRVDRKNKSLYLSRAVVEGVDTKFPHISLSAVTEVLLEELLTQKRKIESEI